VLNPPNRGTLEIIENGAALRYTPSPDNTALNYVETFTYEISSGGTSRSQALITIEVLDRVGVRNLETNHDLFSVRSDSAGSFLSVLANDGVMPASASGWFITEITPPTANVCSAFIPGDFANPSVLAAKLVASADPLSNFLWLRFSPASQAVLASPSSTDLQLQIVLVNELNAVVNSGASIHDGTRFGGVTLRAETQELLTKGAVGEQLLVLNRLLLEDGFPVEIRQSSSGGSVQIINNEVFYAPQQGFVGTQRFTYRVSDGLGGTGFAEVIVKVGDISVSDDAFTLVSDSGTVLLDVTANDGILRTGFPIEPDPDQADFTLSQSALISVNPPTAGVAVPSGELVSFTPSPAFSGRAVLTYQVDDDSGCRFPGIAYLDIRAPGGDRDKATVTINVTGVNDEPFILGANPSTTDDRTALRPFENATVIEYDNQRTEQVVIRITYPSNQGTLTGNFTEIAPGVLEFTGTAAQITAAIRGLVFTPSNNRITVGTTEDTKFTVSLDDGAVTTPVIVESAVTTVVPINDAPVITGTVAAQKLYQRSVLRPFAGVNITDVDDLTLQPLLVSVTVNDAIDGKFTNLGGFTEQPSGSGIYVFNGSAANSAAALRALVFEPTTGNRIASLSSKTVNFTLSVNDGFLPAVVDTVTSVILLHGQVDNLLPLNATGQDISEAAAAYGSSVAVSGDTMAVGSPGRNTPGGDAGRVYIYERNAGFGAPWGQVAEIIGSDTVAGDRFGESVAIDGNFMVVGASRANPVGANSGAAYVFQRSSTNPNSWIQVAKLVPNATGFADGFGTAVALQAGSILVGAPYAFFPNHFFAGKVFAYELGVGGPGNWVRTQIISPAENLTSGFASEGAFFGFSLAFDGNTAVIGAYGANRSFARNEDLNHGAAYVFERTAQGQPWTEFKRIDRFNDSDSKPYDSIGYSVDISGDRIVVGQHATASLAGVFNSGGARIYERNIGGTDRWGLAKAIDASDNPLSKNFGYSVSISGDFVMIGSPTPSQGVSENRGFTEVYRREIGTAANWNMIDRVSPGSAASSDRFGHAVAIDGFTGLIGSTTNSVNGSNIPGAGRAMVYQFQYDLGPRLIQAIPNQIAENGIPFSFSVDPATFDDPVPPGNLTVNLSLQDGSPLPPGSWLSFDQNLMRFTGTPSPTNKASYDLVLTATNSQGSQVASNVFRIETTFDLTVAYSAWASTHFTPAELNNPALKATLWGMSANPDGDDSSNLLEMLFGTDPKSPDVPEIVFTKLNATQVSLEFARSLEFPADEYEVEWSINLVDWFTTGVSTGELAGDPGFVDVTSVVTSSVIQPKIFVRVVVGR
jgi:hypothetical protein